MREYLKEGTYVRFPGGDCYQINAGIGEGGGSLLYSAGRLTYKDGNYISESKIRYALKECFPFSRQFTFMRLPSGEVCPEEASEEAGGYLRFVASMQLNEGRITSDIYDTEAIRMVPIQQVSGGVEISFDQGKTFAYVANTFTVMTSLENRGESIAAWYKKAGKPVAAGIFAVIREVLLALREIHRAGYLHLDLQEGNIFVTGDWRDQSVSCFLIDFGSARKMMEDGRCAENGSQPVFSSDGYRAPELMGIITGKDRNFRLGREADLYSVGYLLLFLLTGRHYDEAILAKLRTEYGKQYLTRKNIQELKVPAYAEELIQHMLSAALEERPENRYQSADEMLKDVDKLLEALAPHRPRISGLAYDAYILYQAENKLHKMAAEALQKRLEHFRTPGLKRIRRVFLDSTELSADHQADGQLAEALKDSDYLIIIGGNSQDDPIWRTKEVNFFLKHHDPSHVLTVITALTDEAELLPVVRIGGREKVVPLAADARGCSEWVIRKKIRRDAALRIAAPILAVPYDGLVQRYRRYRRRKLGSIAAAVFLLVSGFAGYAGYQKWQIQLEHALAEKNRAQNLCTAAMHQYEGGDKKEALSTLMLSFEENKSPEEYVIPEQVYALHTMLNAYASGHTAVFAPEAKITDIFSDVIYSDQQNYLYGLDARKELQVISTEKDAVVWTVRAEMIQETLQDPEAYPPESFDHISLACPLGEEKVLIVLDYLAAVANVRTQTIEKVFPLEREPSLQLVYAASETLFAYGTAEQELHVYDPAAGEQEACISWDSGEFGQRIWDISFSADESRIAFGTTEGIWVYNTEQKTEKKITDASVCDVLFTDSGNLAAVQYEEQPEGTQQVKDFWQDQKSGYTPVLYNDGTGAILSEGNTQNGYIREQKGTASVKFMRHGEETEVWASWMRGDLRLMDAASGMLLEEISYHSDIVAVRSLEGHSILVGLSDGSVCLLRMFGDSIIRRTMYTVGEELYDFFYDQKQQKLLLYTENGIVFCKQAVDAGMDLHETESFIYDVESMSSVNAGRYRCIWFSDGLAKNGLTLYSMNDDTVVFSYTCEAEMEIEHAYTGVVQGKEYLLLLERSTSEFNVYRIKKIALSGQKEMTEYDLSFTEDAGIWQGISPIIYAPDLEHVYTADRQGQLIQVNLTEKTTVPVSVLTEEEILDMSLHKDGDLLHILSAGNGQMKLLVYSLKEQRVTAEQSFACGQKTRISDASSVVKNHEETTLAVYDQEHMIYLLDAENLQIRQTIEVGKKEKLQLDFIQNGTCLLGADKETVWLYALEEQEMVSTYPLNQVTGYGLVLSADREHPYFCLKDASVYENPTTNEGISTQKLHIFFVDDELQIYPFADVDYGYKLPDSSYIMSVYEERFGYASGELYDFSSLYEKAAVSVKEEMTDN